METVLLSFGGAAGAVARYIVSELLADSSFPWATLSVNAVGSFVLGVVLLGSATSDVRLLVAVGFCGAFTTFSSFSFQTVELWEGGEHTRAVLNAIGTLAVSLLAFAVAGLLVG